LPGWRTPVSELIIDDSSLPKDWMVLFPEDTSFDPTVNHVGRSWGHPSGAHAEEVLWRSFTISDAKAKFEQLVSQPPLHSGLKPFPTDFIVEFRPPPDMTFHSQNANQYYLACGWIIWAYCEIVVRYRNYVVDFRLDRKAELENHYSVGLTDPDIERLLSAMDARFAESLDDMPTPAAKR
jgi:hypothetical protein